MDKFPNTQAFYQQAKAMLPADVFSFIDGGSLDELALHRNRQSFNDILISPRILRGLTNVSTAYPLFGQTFSAPILIAPSAYQGLLSPQGELDMLAAANQFNTIFISSMFSSMDYAEIAKHKNQATWLQMYFLQDRKINANFLKMAEALKFDAIVLTVDTPVYAKRERENAQPLNFANHSSFSHLEKIGIPFAECLKTKKHLSTLLDPTISWKDLDWLTANTSLPIILKGIIDPRDTEIALRYPQVKGIVISNHGGRQLDSSYAPMEVITQHKKIIGQNVKLFLDGGIRRGSDVFKALALGAEAILIGRTALWALSVAGKQGVYHALSLLQKELLETMTLCGCDQLSKINSDFINYKDNNNDK